MLNQIIKKILYLFFIGVVVLTLLEITYRFYFIDFYKPELKIISSVQNDSKHKTKILVFGDSFSAANPGYLDILSDSLSNCEIFNASISGTTVYHANLIAKKRLNDVKPDLVIYQVYVGNDLLEFNHNFLNNKRTPFLRKWYWWFSDRIRVLGFINYRMRNFRGRIYDDLAVDPLSRISDKFSPELYSKRTKLYLESNPFYINHSIGLHPDINEITEQYFKNFEEMVQKILPPEKLIILIIPHCSQVSPYYRDNMKLLGARFNSDTEILEVNYAYASQIEKKLTGYGITIINVLDYFQNDNDIDNLYLVNDPHLSNYGQKVLASGLIEQLKSR